LAEPSFSQNFPDFFSLRLTFFPCSIFVLNFGVFISANLSKIHCDSIRITLVLYGQAESQRSVPCFPGLKIPVIAPLRGAGVRMRLLHSGNADTSIVQVQHDPILMASKAAIGWPHPNKEVHVMAVSTHITKPHGVSFAPVTSWFHGLREQFARRRAFRRTLNELSALSAHQLADLGLHRSNLRQTAYQATYHQLR
jgi:uncharacterized protein YjiS (DUF1127 family)